MQIADRRRLHRRCRARVEELLLPFPLRPEAVKERLEGIRDREIWVLPDGGALPAQISGLWLGAATRDYVYFREGLAGCRLDHTLMHEFAHMMCHHRSATLADREWLRAQAPQLVTGEDIEHICMRSNFDSADEQEAELMASLMLARMSTGPSLDRAATDGGTAARVESIFLT